MKKTAKGLDALKQTKPTPRKESAPEPEKTTREKVVFSLHLPADIHQQLREVSFHERISMTKIILAGVEAELKKRGMG